MTFPRKAQRGAVLQGSSYKTRPFYAITNASIEPFDDEIRKRLCEICPEGAIDFEKTGDQRTFEADGVVLATGYDPFDPREKPRFNFERHPNMITALELEQMLRTDGGAFRPSDGKYPENVAFIQCVGSRDSSLGHNFCSRVCCGYALRMGKRIKHDRPETNVTVFYMDIQTFGKDFEKQMKDAEEKLRFIRCIPGDYYPTDKDGISVFYYDRDQKVNVQEDFDLLVLSVGIMPKAENSDLCALFGVGTKRVWFRNKHKPGCIQRSYTGGNH